MNELRVELPPDIADRFTTLASGVGSIHRSLGRVMDEYLTEFTHTGYHETIYALFADLYYRVTGDYRSPRTLRMWRDSVKAYSKTQLREYEPLTDAQLIEAVSLATVAKVEPSEICDWAVSNQVSSVPQLRAHWLPQTSTDAEIDDPFISSAKRGIGRYQDHPRYPRLVRIVELLRREIKIIKGA